MAVAPRMGDRAAELRINERGQHGERPPPQPCKQREPDAASALEHHPRTGKDAAADDNPHNDTAELDTLGLCEVGK